MKQTKLFKGLLVATLLLCSPSLWAYDFTAKNDDGKTIYYTIVSKDDRTCEVVNIGQLNLYIGDIVIPETVTRSGTTYTVIGIGEFAFLLCYDLTSVSIPNSVTYIGTGAFEGDDKLTYIDIPNSVTSMGESAFEGCTGLKEVTIGNSVTTIGYRAFGGCTGLTSIEIPDSVTTIEREAFQYCTGLTSVNFGNSVTTIGTWAFHGCTGLTYIDIPDSVTTIGWGAFEGCTGLTGELKIPDSVTTIESSAFEGCARLTFVNINNCVAEIDGRVFDGCTSLEKFEVAESNQAYSTNDGILFSKDMTTLFIFPHGSPLLPSYDIPNGVTTIGDYAFYDCTGLTSVAIPNSVTEIGGSAFCECSGLTSATIGNNVTTIESWAFGYCSGLTSVIIGKRVDYIGKYGFYGCTSLEEIYSLNPEPPECYYNTFDGVDKEACTLYVPIGTYGKYSGNFVHNTNNYWKEFLNIVEMDMTGIESVIASSEDVEVVGYYTIDGKAVENPQRGVNIVKFSDGSTKKVLVK